MTTTTGWLLLVVVVSCRNVDSQSTTNNQRCDEQLSLQRQMMTMQETLDRMLLQFRTITTRLDELGKLMRKPRDCSDIYKSGERSDGVYTVYVGSAQRPVQVYCDMTTDGGAWTVFQRRQDGSEDFYRNWTDYETGFGNPSGEFWLGNYNLHLLTSGSRQQLRIDLADFRGNRRYATYDDFEVGSARTKYKLISLGAYTGTAGDSLSRHLGHKFSTRDQDNDVHSTVSCAVIRKGAWWYYACYESNLNGHYFSGTDLEQVEGIRWNRWTLDSLRMTEMKIRPYGL